MSLARTDFKRLAAAVAPFALAFGFAANDANALEFKCKPLDTIQAEMKAEGLGPAMRYYFSTPEGKNGFSVTREIVAYNDVTKDGYLLLQDKEGGNWCPLTRLSEIEFFSPDSGEFNKKAYLRTPQSMSDGKGGVEIGIDQYLHSWAVKEGKLPVMRAKEYNQLAKKGDEHRYIYIIQDVKKSDGSGEKAYASFEGVPMFGYFRDVLPANAANGIKHGLEFTKYGKQYAQTPSSKRADAGATTVLIAPQP